jgi:acetolactate synthase-1/2/3 large subunit
MTLSDRIVEFLEEHVDHVFTVSGGGSIFLCDALARAKKMRYVCCHHEQAAGYAAEAYARLRGLGVCLVTSGPGGTNAVSAAASAWLDSVPVIFISGQAFLSQTIGEAPTRGLRQLGVQEINIIDIVKPITKYAVMVKYATQIDVILRRALKHAKTGRPGPVWLDVPGNVQNAKYK